MGASAPLFLLEENTMYLQGLNGKLVVRTKVGYNGDRSYMGHAILIEKIVGEIIYYRYDPGGEIRILPTDENDGHWQEVDEPYIKEHWPNYKLPKEPKQPVPVPHWPALYRQTTRFLAISKSLYSSEHEARINFNSNAFVRLVKEHQPVMLVPGEDY